MIKTFVGEFLSNPIPLEVALHRCNYGCVYCFATLNYRHAQYTYSPKDTFRQLATLRDKKSLTARLLRDGYPVCLSNHVDPFCSANLDITRSLVTTLRAMQIPMMFQTKGGVPDDILDAQPPSVWYITITTDNEAIRQRYEPAAPPIAERLRLIRRLTERGHIVVIGMNPYLPEWWTDERAALAQFKALGAHGVWSELLHFHYRQRDQLTAKEKAALMPDLLDQAMRRHPPEEWLSAWDMLQTHVIDAGLWPYHGIIGKYSEFFTPYHTVYPKLFPTLQEFSNFNHIIQRDATDFITEKEFVGWFAEDLPTGRYNEINSYIGATNHDLFWENKIPNALTFKELLSLIWRNIQIKMHPAKKGSLKLPYVFDERGEQRLVCDKDGLPLMSFVNTEMWGNSIEVDKEDVAVWYDLKYPDDAPEERRQELREIKARITQARLETIEALTQQSQAGGQG